MREVRTLSIHRLEQMWLQPIDCYVRSFSGAVRVCGRRSASVLLPFGLADG